MRLSSLLFAAVLTLSTAAACAPAAEPSDPPPAGAGTAAAAQRTWEANRPAAYAYGLEISCFCIHRGQYAVEARNGQITSVRDAATGQPAEASRVEWIITVDRLFEVIGQASQAGTPVRAEYHPQLGYPVEAEVGMLADDSGTLYRITNLRAL
ncbi:MAG TPA: DUF6174 domain-containing protein [Longimicrobium sp.]|nr:DUF6174 domain-containing protein [Longimicrobium sp.]